MKAVVLSCGLLVLVHPAIGQTKIYINSHEIQADSIETNGTLYVPLDAVARALGATVTVMTNSTPTSVAPLSAPASPAEASAEKSRPSTTVQLTTPAAQEFGSIQGAVRFRRNVMDWHGIDAGAEVWLIPEEMVASLAAAAGGTDKEPIPPSVAGWEKKLTAQFGSRHEVADARGEFAFTKVAPGDYTLVLLSRNVGGLARRDNRGKMHFVKATVRDGLATDLSYNFGLSTWFEENGAKPK
jgi:hypothetical protein